MKHYYVNITVEQSKKEEITKDGWPTGGISKEE